MSILLRTDLLRARNLTEDDYAAECFSAVIETFGLVPTAALTREAEGVDTLRMMAALSSVEVTEAMRELRRLRHELGSHSSPAVTALHCHLLSLLLRSNRLAAADLLRRYMDGFDFRLSPEVDSARMRAQALTLIHVQRPLDADRQLAASWDRFSGNQLSRDLVTAALLSCRGEPEDAAGVLEVTIAENWADDLRGFPRAVELVQQLAPRRGRFRLDRYTHQN